MWLFSLKWMKFLDALDNSLSISSLFWEADDMKILDTEKIQNIS